MDDIKDIIKLYKNNKLALPYVVRVAYAGVEPSKNFVIFGFDKYQDAVNFGSDVGVTYQVAGGNATYRELLAQSKFKNFKVKHWQIISSNAANLNQSILLNYEDANGRQIDDPITFNAHKDCYQISPTMILLDYKATIDGIFYINGTLTSSSSLTFCVYPDIIVDNSALIYDEGDLHWLQQYEEPILSKYLEFLKTKK